MHKIILLLSLVLTVTISSCNSKKSGQTTSDSGHTKVELQTYAFAVEGMTCSGCEQTIQTNIKKIDGVEIATASLASKNAVVTFNPNQTDTVAIKKAIVSSGYVVNRVTKSMN